MTVLRRVHPLAIRCALLLLCGWGFCAPLSDTHGSLFDWLTNGDRTRYAPGFTEVGFKSLRVAMAQEQVRQTPGEPLFKNEPSFHGGEEIWFYSYFNGEHHGWGRGRVMRNVLFKKGVVVGTHAYYDPDS